MVSDLRPSGLHPLWFPVSTRIRTPQRTVLGEREQVITSQVEQTLRDECFTHFDFCGFISVSFDSRGHVILSVWTMYYVKKKVKFFSLLDLCCSLAISFHRDLIGPQVLWESLPIMLFFLNFELLYQNMSA